MRLGRAAQETVPADAADPNRAAGSMLAAAKRLTPGGHAGCINAAGFPTAAAALTASAQPPRASTLRSHPPKSVAGRPVEAMISRTGRRGRSRICLAAARMASRLCLTGSSLRDSAHSEPATTTARSSLAGLRPRRSATDQLPVRLPAVRYHHRCDRNNVAGGQSAALRAGCDAALRSGGGWGDRRGCRAGFAFDASRRCLRGHRRDVAGRRRRHSRRSGSASGVPACSDPSSRRRSDRDRMRPRRPERRRGRGAAPGIQRRHGHGWRASATPAPPSLRATPGALRRC